MQQDGHKRHNNGIFNLKQPPGANKYPKYTAVYSKYTAVYSRVYGRILRYWSLEYTAVYPKSPKWGIFKHNIDHHNWQTRGIPQPTYACIVHYTFVPTCTCHIPLSPKTPFFTRIPPGIPGMPGYAHHIPLATGTHFIKSGLPVCPVFPFRAVCSSKTCTLRRFTQFMQFMQTEQVMQFMRFVLVYQKTGPDRSRPVLEQTA